jgi:predicted nucleotidyltransferase component of viral defense system
MIPKSELLNQAKNLGLLPQVIEKDYVLGWVLAGISDHPQLKNNWIFKGGTCLKKAYFEEYRFSEDLDFTVLDQKQIALPFLTEVFREISAWVYEESGIQIPETKIEFELYKTKREQVSCQGKLSYIGPLTPTSPRQWPRIKLDLTANEILVGKPLEFELYHPYSDLPKSGIHILSYSYSEIFAEKIRALVERTRPRDLYDVIHLFHHLEHQKSQETVLNFLKQKCDFKGVQLPTMESLEKQQIACSVGWTDQLSHQINNLEPCDYYWSQLPDLLKWLRLI